MSNTKSPSSFFADDIDPKLVSSTSASASSTSASSAFASTSASSAFASTSASSAFASPFALLGDGFDSSISTFPTKLSPSFPVASPDACGALGMNLLSLEKKIEAVGDVEVGGNVGEDDKVGEEEEEGEEGEEEEEAKASALVDIVASIETGDTAKIRELVKDASGRNANQYILDMYDFPVGWSASTAKIPRYYFNGVEVTQSLILAGKAAGILPTDHVAFKSLLVLHKKGLGHGNRMKLFEIAKSFAVLLEVDFDISPKSIDQWLDGSRKDTIFSVMYTMAVMFEVIYSGEGGIRRQKLETACIDNDVTFEALSNGTKANKYKGSTKATSKYKGIDRTVNKTEATVLYHKARMPLNMEEAMKMKRVTKNVTKAVKSEEEWSGEVESGGEEESGEDSDGEDDEAVPVKSAYELLAEANKAKNARRLASLGLGKGEWRNQGISGDYLFDMGNDGPGKDIFIDGEDADVSSWCRFVNHAKEELKDNGEVNDGACNVEMRRRLSWDQDEVQQLGLFMVALRDIEPGTEICCDYGGEYW